MSDLLMRLTSRKFALAVASGVFGCLAAAGVVPADAVARDTAIAAPLLFIAVEGVADLLERHALSQKTVSDAADIGKAAALAVLAAQGAGNADVPAEAISPAA